MSEFDENHRLTIDHCLGRVIVKVENSFILNVFIHEFLNISIHTLPLYLLYICIFVKYDGRYSMVH